VGPHHPIFGYFTYPSALAFIGVGWSVDCLAAKVESHGRSGRVISWALLIVLVVSLLPGSGIRVTLAYLKHWDRVDYNGPKFAGELLENLPAEATFVVDEEFTLDFIAANRRTIACLAFAKNHIPWTTPYDYRIQSRSTDRYPLNLTWDDELMWVAGDPSDPYGIYVRVFQKQTEPAIKN
jgi:hypothetical protein